MTSVLVLYYSSYGHIETMAYAVAEGARAAGAKAFVKRVPELVSHEIARASGYKLDQEAPIAQIEELRQYDAIIFGTGTRFGNMTAQMKNFIDQMGPLWTSGALVGKVGSVFSSSGTQHGGQESTILTFHPVLLHLGMVIAGLPYSFQAQTGVEEVMGNTPYGASTIVDPTATVVRLAWNLRVRAFRVRISPGSPQDFAPDDSGSATSQPYANRRLVS